MRRSNRRSLIPTRLQGRVRYSKASCDLDELPADGAKGGCCSLVPLALLLPARSADRKKGLLPFGRRGGIASGLLNAARLSSLLLGFAGSSSRSLGSFRGRSLCGFACYRLAPDPLSFCDPDVACCDDPIESLVG